MTRLSSQFVVASVLLAVGACTREGVAHGGPPERKAKGSLSAETCVSGLAAHTEAVKEAERIRSVREALEIVHSETRLQRVVAAAFYLGKHREGLVHLLPDLLSRREIGLTETADLIIPVRVSLGDLKSYGHGGRVEDDLFVLAGRANWILRVSTCRTFGAVDLYTPVPRLALLRELWKRRLAGEEIGLPIEDKRAGLLRLMSRQAISDAISALALAEVTKHVDRQKEIASELQAVTGEKLGTSAATWNKWFDGVWHALYFDWRKVQMVVTEDKRSTDEYSSTIPPG